MAYLGAAYLWVKAAHVIFVIFLMAGLFMMPRFFNMGQMVLIWLGLGLVLGVGIGVG